MSNLSPLTSPRSGLVSAWYWFGFTLSRVPARIQQSANTVIEKILPYTFKMLAFLLSPFGVALGSVGTYLCNDRFVREAQTIFKRYSSNIQANVSKFIRFLRCLKFCHWYAIKRRIDCTAMIEVREYTKRYGKHEAVSQLSFTVEPGRVFGLLGSNGAGKTTTIRALVGLTRPSSGTVCVGGFDVWKEPVKAKMAFGYIPDRPYLYGKLTARELLRFVGQLYKVTDMESKIDQWLERFRLMEFGNELIETFSHGMRQKVAIIAAMLPDPPVLIIDEPMVGLDPHAAKQVRDLFRGHADKGRTVLLTTHSLPIAEAVCDRLVVLDRGKVLGEGSMDELRARTGTAAGGVHGDSLERIFFKLIEEEKANAKAALEPATEGTTGATTGTTAGDDK